MMLQKDLLQNTAEQQILLNMPQDTALSSYPAALIFVVLKYSSTRQAAQTIPKIREATVIELPTIPMIHVVT